jgi:hypothetical protein
MASTGGGGKTPSDMANAAEVASADLPTALDCGASYPARVTMKNIGTASWTRAAGYKLGMVDDSDPFFGADTRVWLDENATVLPGATHEFKFLLTAPGQAGDLVTDWRMVQEGVEWFGAIAKSPVKVACNIKKRTGLVKLDKNSLSDDQGHFNALGTTMFWAAWAYKNDKAKLEANLDFLAKNGFDYIRALGVVGDYEKADYWDGREIDWHWPDYAQVIAGLTDLAYDKYGLRVEWTLIGDGQVNIPKTADRYALVDTFLAMSKGREQKIIHFEIANESWQNGFSGDSGLAELRALSKYMKDKTDILVAASAPWSNECSEVKAVYAGAVADLATLHFDRDISKADGNWRPVRQPWEHAYCQGEGVPVGSNNEPIGPGSSVSTENDPDKLVAAAITTYVANIPLYVFHTKAGVRGDLNIWEMAGAKSFLPMKQAKLVPDDLASWSRKNAHWSDAPFVVYAGENGKLTPGAWTDVSKPESGVVRSYGDVKGNDFFVYPIGILNKVVMEPRKAMTFDVIDPMTAKVVKSYDLAAGAQFELSGAKSFVLRGKYK